MERVPPARLPGPHEVRVRVAWCGLCGTDVHEYRSGPHYITVDPHPLTSRSAPVILGHEISGWVETVGAQVPGLAEGDLVGLNAVIPCGRCVPCGGGATHRCQGMAHLGLSADGGLAELVTVPAQMVVRAPGGMDAEVAALSEPFAVAVHAVRQANCPQGTECAVVGGGAIGLAVAMLLRARGNAVTVIDIAEPRLRRASELGFDARPAGTELLVPVVFECAGAPAAPATAFTVADTGGVVVLVGLSETPSAVDFRVVVGRELRVVGSTSHLAGEDLGPALDFLAVHGERAARMVTARVPLEGAVDRGLDVLAGPDGEQHTKILVRVHGGDDR